MDLNGWLTVISVFIAILALIPREELRLKLLSVTLFEKVTALVVIVFVIPGFIVTPKIVSHFHLESVVYVWWGFAPENIAFALFYCCFIWLAFRYYFSSNLKFTEKGLILFQELLYEKSFEEFFKLFTKYTSPVIIEKHWERYKGLILSPTFLNGLRRKSDYLIQFWHKLDNEDDFKQAFKFLLDNPESVYYSEIREHWNTYGLRTDQPFLNKILKEHLISTIENKGLKFFYDYVLIFLLSENKNSIYNQTHYVPRDNETEGYDLALYNHIRFIGLLYTSAIENKISITNLNYSLFHTLYSSISKKIVENMTGMELNSTSHNQTNYHWILKELFDIQKNWIQVFSEKKHFIKNSSFTDFITNSISLCLDTLYKGYKKGKVTSDFIVERVHYDVLVEYFYFKTNSDIKKSIEENVITKIPEEHLQNVLDYSLDERFAIDFTDFSQRHFGSTTSKEEKEVLSNLWNLLFDETK